DPLRYDLDDPEERRRLARVLDRGLGREVGFVLPLRRAKASNKAEGRPWQSERWRFRREHLFLVPGDSPVGLRLPLRSLPKIEDAVPSPPEERVSPPDPRREEDDPDQPHAPSITEGVRTALCVEPREDALYVFLPPLASAAD